MVLSKNRIDMRYRLYARGFDLLVTFAADWTSSASSVEEKVCVGVLR